MNQSFKKIIILFGRYLSYVIPFFFINYYKKIKILIFSGFIKGQFKALGENSIIFPPVNLKGGKFISIGKNFHVLSNFWIEAIDNYMGIIYVPEIYIGNFVSFNNNCHLACINKIYIGNNVLVASNVFITDHFHGDSTNLSGSPVKRELISKGAVIIEDNVWIGEGVVILPNVIIGRNSIIGANSVVNKSFPAFSIIGGIPAKLLKINNE